MLNNMRYDPDGTSYKTSATAAGDARGAPSSGLKGYELEATLDFTEGASYESGAVNTTWCTGGFQGDQGNPCDPVSLSGAPRGWTPIEEFRAIFDGNGYAIYNLYIHSTASDDAVGMFATLTDTASVERLELRYVSYSCFWQKYSER